MADHSHSGVRVILVPYDAGQRGFRMGRGPEALISHGLEEALRVTGPGISTVTVNPDNVPTFEVYTAFELDRLVAEEVKVAVDAGEFPLVLSGNCNTAVGTIAGAGAEDLGVIWLDAHPDFETPETTTTGFTDCVGLAITAGHCWNAMAATIPGFRPVPETRILPVGTRGMSQAERARLEGSGITVVDAAAINRDGLADVLGDALGSLRDRVEKVYVHLDLDVLDPDSVGPANEFAVPGGLTRAECEAATSMIGDHFTVVAAGIASYDPAFDGDGAVAKAAVAGLLALGSIG